MQANQYFSSDSARQCKPTDYAVANGAYVNSDNGNCWWWLRSPGNNQNSVELDEVRSTLGDIYSELFHLANKEDDGEWQCS